MKSHSLHPKVLLRMLQAIEVTLGRFGTCLGVLSQDRSLSSGLWHFDLHHSFDRAEIGIM